MHHEPQGEKISFLKLGHKKCYTFEHENDMEADNI